ncbi:MAG: 3-isopropylmalate dehydratase small subunit [Candidatus Omnitrophica bacterium]|nr:3-isopropylmalate dehydratase small subunit [Candidatus Omnitrophota bacterium]MDD5352700.1 3-isopropylmalate dehydratase small subunit [Candidatus Omnitrophota bacterium]MDD5550299.1 3-isopropylmalate dehydratase small subunit [Candidatus Omnitrophota bacterium]
MIIKGKVHKFGNDVNTDDIIAAKYLNTTDAKELGRHCMETVAPEFAQKVLKGDIIVGGRNFGCGSSREHAPVAIKGCGVSLVIAESFARIFFRNSINIGLPILELKQVNKINEGDELEVDLAKGEVKNSTQNITYKSEAFADFMQELVQSGGLMKWIRRKQNTK